MATTNGNSGLVKIGANTVAEVIDFSLDQSVATADDTQLSDTSMSHLIGKKSWGGSVNCYMDKSDTNGQVAMANGAAVTLLLYPAGAGSGAVEFTGLTTISNVSISNAGDTTIPTSFTFVGNGDLTEGTVV